jgi:hypothetical protein
MEHHYMGGDDTIQVNLFDCLKWLACDWSLDREEMEYHVLIQKIIDEVMIVMDSDETIDFLDRSTRGEHDLTKAEDMIWNHIAPRAAHQQRVENLVQTAKHIGKTHVDETRRSARAKIHCTFYRDFKTWALNIVRTKAKAKHEQQIQQLLQQPAAQQTQQTLSFRRPNKLDGKQEFELWAQWIDTKLNNIEAAEAYLQPERMKEIVAELGSKKEKISAVDDDARVLKYRQAATSTKDRTLESKHLADITPWMEGSIILSYLTGKVNARPYVMAEIEHRGIDLPSKTKDGKAVTDWKDLNLNLLELRHILRNHERSRLSMEEDKVFAKVEEVKYVKLLSDKMKEWMPKQWNIYKQKKGIVIAEPE